jgi:hypothetical protein
VNIQTQLQNGPFYLVDPSSQTSWATANYGDFLSAKGTDYFQEVLTQMLPIKCKNEIKYGKHELN